VSDRTGASGEARCGRGNARTGLLVYFSKYMRPRSAEPEILTAIDIRLRLITMPPQLIPPPL
jgi:hypothetical protein